MTGGATGTVRWVLRLEGLCVLAAALFAYYRLDFGWARLALCFFAPDVAFFGYLAGPRAGAIAYNSVHSYLGAIVCGVAGILLQVPVLVCARIIWCAHIGFDRAWIYAFGLHW